MRQAPKTKWYLLGLVLTAVAAFVAGSFYYRAPLPQDAVDRSMEEELISSGTQQGGIPPIDDPQFERVAFADQYLNNHGFGLDVAVDGNHRFYPYQILVWHEVVNDTFNGTPLLVTYSPLTNTGIVFDRSVGGGLAQFGTSGTLWNNNLVIFDRATESSWVQILGEAVSGPMSGTKLEPYPSKVMSWQEWKDEYPRGEVLSRDTGADRDYTRDPYGDYYATNAVWFPLSVDDPRLPLKELMYGVIENGRPVAYPAQLVDEGKITIDEAVNPLLAYWFIWSNAYPETEIYLP